ncbi:MAG: sugar phosphate nucleotidyltransferase, partial [bacterium]
MRKQPTKAVIAAAGLGTRFLPQTKAMPKEMLPIIDKPVIQIIVEQLVASGVTDIIIVTGSTKRAIEDHFDRSDELEQELREKGKNELAEEIKKIAELANFIYIRQKGTPKGNARPLINASHLLAEDEPFYMYFADDFFRSEIPHAKQMLDVYNQTGKSV